MADLILSSDEPVPDDTALLTMQDLLAAVMQIEETTKPVISRRIRIVIDSRCYRIRDNKRLDASTFKIIEE